MSDAPDKGLSAFLKHKTEQRDDPLRRDSNNGRARDPRKDRTRAHTDLTHDASATLRHNSFL